ncbi:hypothetical protein PAMP_015448 [Pampus punctatissimus]
MLCVTFVFQRPVTKRSRKRSSRPRTSSPQRKQPQTQGRRRNSRVDREIHSSAKSDIPRSQSLSPLRAGNRDTSRSSQSMLASWPGASRSASPHRSIMFTNSSSPLTRSSSTVRYSPTGQRQSLSNGLVGGISEDDSSSSETHDPLDYHQGPERSAVWLSYREQDRHRRSQSCSHREWEEVHERVRGLLTTPKAVRRLVYGATHSEVDEILARRSISPGPP